MLHRLPVSAYTDREWFDREQDLIFSRCWHYAGLMEDVSEPGQYISVQAGLNNIFIVMGRDRRLRAFHNICRHRGTQLIRAVGKAQKALTCPYHDWTYDLEGNLISVPEEDREFENIDKSCLGLKPAAVDIWKSMLFVHPDPKAGSIMDWFGPVDDMVGPHVPEELPEYAEARAEYEIKANWKIVVDNYIDVYHLSHLHSGTLQMYDHAKAEFGFVGPHYMFWEPPVEAFARNQDKKLTMPRVIPRRKSRTNPTRLPRRRQWHLGPHAVSWGRYCRFRRYLVDLYHHAAGARSDPGREPGARCQRIQLGVQQTVDALVRFLVRLRPEGQIRCR